MRQKRNGSGCEGELGGIGGGETIASVYYLRKNIFNKGRNKKLKKFKSIILFQDFTRKCILLI